MKENLSSSSVWSSIGQKLHKNKKNLISVLLFLLLAALTFSAICKGNDMTEVAKAVRKMDAWYLFGAMGLGIFFVSAEGLMICYLLRALGNPIAAGQVHQIFLYRIFLFGNHTVRHRRTADAALSYEKGWVEDIGKYCGLNDGSSALQICAGGDWDFHAAVWLSSAKELSGKLYVAFLSGTTVKYSAGDFSFNRDVRAKAVSQYCDRSRAVLRTVSPAETLGGTN